jgi:hypothetical protein
MIIAKNDEAKRSKIWRMGVIISTLLIIFIGAYLIMKIVSDNPVDGKWMDTDGNYALNIKDNGKLTITVQEDDGEVIKATYTLDTEEKTMDITFGVEQTEDAFANSFGSTFNYSIENGQLTLTEREYGEQMIFVEE